MIILLSVALHVRANGKYTLESHPGEVKCINTSSTQLA